ncbi:unnamed protein product [Effrenium voratum]|uniref:Peptidase M1 leukotriene A4 hydrolase/aminopeptidase C-terminal domain-containing protein n=1 Tax=Effrenium voratum TaxID=2562239 RepID=A0AA36JD41_9DINO|nr:unnamed protein product [Effrenium voratum]CAJ1424432.1 unnamed protein product [Effrenium voratum]
MPPKKRPAAQSASGPHTAKRPAAAIKRPAGHQAACPHSVSNFSEALVERLDLQLKVDFDRQVLAGECQLTVRSLQPVDHVILDVLDLEVQEVTKEDGTAVQWKVQKPPGAKANFGQSLTIDLDAEVTKVCVKYETTEKSTALQWLRKEQTQGKEFPLCFTQSQAICGRSLLPCQDTPSVKAPFTIALTVPAALTAVASGNPSGDVVTQGDSRTFKYEQNVPVMSYLIGFVVARLESCRIGPRSTCYAEPGVLQAAQKEFQDIVEEFIITAQEVVGGADYEWGSYNVAVMPSSFAYGGMENPNCTFMSASLIPGDRSLTPTLAHEIVHSWIGNLVTNAFWKDFWLNEGFTRYIERRVLGKLYGPAFRGLLLMVGYNDLVKAVEMLTKQGTPGLTRLEPQIDEIDPDDAFSRVPYEKGSLFLIYLEQIVGGEQAMTDWLRSYVQEFRGRSIETADFKAHFLKFFRTVKRVNEVDWEHWLHGEGLPDFDLSAHADKSLLDECRSLADSWLQSGSADVETGHMKAQQWMLFLDHLINAVVGGKQISEPALAEMDGKYKFSATANVEVSFRWCLLGCRCRWRGCLDLTAKFLASHGRGVYVKPLYLALKDFDEERARSIFQQNRSFYMSVVTRQVAAFLDK